MNLIPYPTEWKPKNGVFYLGANVAIESAPEANAVAALLASLPPIQNPGKVVVKTDDRIQKEGYRLDVDAQKIVIAASTDTGFFYAAQSLRALSDADIPNKDAYAVPCGTLEDAPRFGYRGVLFDECRHFFGGETVRRLIDRMAKLKLNTLHWHLNDDQGWRIEIEKYPALTEVGSKRAESQVGGGQSDRYNGIPVSGFYTKREIAEIIAYASARHVVIVPEIDMPGHFTAVLAAYPHLSCTGEAVEVRTRFGVADLIACGGKDEVYRFAEDVLDEVADLFPARYVHVGGDEAPKKYWDTCPDCAKKRAELGLKNSHELQSYFTNRMVGFLKGKGKETIGWNEALKGKGLDPSFIAEYWTPVRDRRAEAYFNGGGRILFARYQPFYFDYSYAQRPLRVTYGFERYAGAFDLQAENLIGLEGTLWTEWIEDEEKLNYQAFPRLLALSECAWSKHKPGYRDFARRVSHWRQILAAWGVKTLPTSFYNPKNPIKRLQTYAKWGLKDPDCEYKIFLERRNKLC